MTDNVKELKALLEQRTGELETCREELRVLREHEKVADLLSISDERACSIFRCTSAGIAIITPQGGFQDVNPAFCDFLGYSRNELLQLSVIDITHPSDREETSPYPGNARDRQRQTLTEGKRYLRKDGATVWGQGRADWFFNEAGIPLYAVAIILDVTHCKQTEAALRESEAIFAKVFHATPTMVVISTLNEGRFIEINDAVERNWGCRRDEIIGRTAQDIGIWENFAERAAVVAALRKGTVVQNREATFRGINGKVFTGLISMELIDVRGETCLLSIINDITDRKRVETALQESEAKFAKAFHAAPSVFSLTDLADGRFIEVNEAFEKAFGYTRQEIIGKTSIELHIWEYPEDRTTMTQALRAEGRVRNFEASFRDKAGRVLVGLYSSELIEINGKMCLLSIMNDVTSRKRMEEKIEILNTDLASRAQELEDANRELEAFNYTVSHDLRSPLTGINGFCQLILDMYGNELSDQCASHVREIHNSSLRMDQLITTLLDFSHLSRCTMNLETVDLSALANGAATQLKMTDPRRNVTFAIAEGLKAVGDARLIRVVMDNLLGNAWKYTAKQEKALIEFGCVVRHGALTYFVRDNGVGFTMADTSKLFQPFQRLSRTTDFPGHGIGLATVQRIIQRHAGRVWAEGNPGKGATFHFTLGKTPS